MEKYQRDLILLKRDNKDLAAALHDERSKSRLTIAQLLDDAEQVMTEALSIEQAANATVNSERKNLQYYAGQIMQSK